jgi:hypothetical protein
VFENNHYASVVGNTASMPYLNSLMGKFGLASQYYANTHPSISNYEMMVTGQVLINDDGETPATFPISVDNIVRELNAVFVSPAFSKPGYQSTTLYQHQSTLRLMLEGLGVITLPSAAATAPAMWEFFTFPAPP